MSKFKRALAAVLAVVCLTVFSVSSVFAADSPTTAKNWTKTINTGRYSYRVGQKVTAKESPKSRTATSDTIVPTVTHDGKVYKVVRIGKYAYRNCNNLKKIKVKSQYCNQVNKLAFKGMKKSVKKNLKVVVTKKMSAKNFKALKKLLVKRGLTAKNITKSKKW